MVEDLEDLHLMRTLDYANKTLKADLGARLNSAGLKGRPTDKELVKAIQNQISCTLDSLIDQEIIRHGHSDVKVNLVDDKVVVDMTFQPFYPLKNVTTTITLDTIKGEASLNEEDRLANEERRFQIYIENKSW